MEAWEYKCPKCGHVNVRVWEAQRLVCDKCKLEFVITSCSIPSATTDYPWRKDDTHSTTNSTTNYSTYCSLVGKRSIELK